MSNTHLSLDQLDAGHPECWWCKIGPTTRECLPDGADFPMREAVRAVFLAVTGHEAEAVFSGWGSRFTEGEQAVIENRQPDRSHPDMIDHAAALADLRAEVEAMRAALLSSKQLDGLADWMLKRCDLDNNAHALTMQILRQKANAARALESTRDAR